VCVCVCVWERERERERNRERRDTITYDSWCRSSRHYLLWFVAISQVIQVEPLQRVYCLLHLGFLFSLAEMTDLMFHKRQLVMWMGRILFWFWSAWLLYSYWWHPIHHPQVPSSICSSSCLPGFSQTPWQGAPHCCFDCSPCPEGQFADQTGEGASNWVRVPIKVLEVSWFASN
jgi:hypothetical protein